MIITFFVCLLAHQKEKKQTEIGLLSFNAYKLLGYLNTGTFMSLCHQGQRDINKIKWH